MSNRRTHIERHYEKALQETENKVRLYWQVNRYEAAEKALRHALDNITKDPRIYNLLGVSLQKQGRFREALAAFADALHLDYQHIEAALNLAMVLNDLCCYQEAQTAFGLAQALLTPGKHALNSKVILRRIADLHGQLANMYERAGMRSEALAEYKKSLRLFDQSPVTQLRLAKLYLEMGHYEKSVTEFAAILKNYPEMHRARLWLGIAYQKLGKKHLASEQWEQVGANKSERNLAQALLKGGVPELQQ